MILSMQYIFRLGLVLPSMPINVHAKNKMVCQSGTNGKLYAVSLFRSIMPDKGKRE